MDELKQLNKEFKKLNEENEILRLKIRIARAEREKKENEEELERLQDPNEPTWRDVPLCSNGPY